MELLQKPLISIAPMLDITNTHFRYFMRLLTKQATLWTEMIHYNAILHNHQHHLPYHPSQHPVVLQLGGSSPKHLAQATILAKQYGYDQVNLNVGCPSPKVQQGSFGACLMKQKQLVAQCLKAMKQSVNGSMDCTVKCRLGVDDFNSYQFVRDFIKQVSQKGQVKHFIIHSRLAYLKGLNPAQNRNIPPLQYQKVFRLVDQFPNLHFSINGGIKTLNQANNLLTQNPKLYGCMIGRTAYQNPYQLVLSDQQIYGKINRPIPTRYQILQKYSQYVQSIQKTNNKINGSVLIKPIINLFHGEKYCARYRQLLSDIPKMKLQGASELIKNANQYMYKMHQKQIEKGINIQGQNIDEQKILEKQVNKMQINS